MTTNKFEMTQNGSDVQLEITRIVNAPRELVYSVWTQPEHLAAWWGPTGMELTVKSLDVRPGGSFHYGMKSPEGFEMFGKFAYREVEAPVKLVYVSSFADAEGNVIRAPFSPVFPIEIINELTLTEEDGQTIITLRGGPINATEEELQFYASMKGSMEQGFGGTFKQLDDYLAGLTA
ncbi:SRPBCC family protein [Paenibacillus roseipurpureus]|uniref:SRPBCC domain-containing protein n=1 Tax=Paenibacillus roseopurpureus TaxID=2918901 RepID=A0AA96RL33_9BACL|nr:SRPBCC domain-containing protein [Paenibacillus sp. MBLB1832]WNR44989.1 SRPBCC domain-containing protein [Paenibacillus sp. MBLB1832]